MDGSLHGNIFVHTFYNVTILIATTYKKVQNCCGSVGDLTLENYL